MATRRKYVNYDAMSVEDLHKEAQKLQEQENQLKNELTRVQDTIEAKGFSPKKILGKAFKLKHDPDDSEVKYIFVTSCEKASWGTSYNLEGVQVIEYYDDMGKLSGTSLLMSGDGEEFDHDIDDLLGSEEITREEFLIRVDTAQSMIKALVYEE